MVVGTLVFGWAFWVCPLATRFFSDFARFGAELFFNDVPFLVCFWLEGDRFFAPDFDTDTTTYREVSQVRYITTSTSYTNFLVTILPENLVIDWIPKLASFITKEPILGTPHP